jgi:hypothetical protein
MDTFHLTVSDGRIVKVRNSSNDPPDFDQAMTWLKRERPEVMSGPCKVFRRWSHSAGLRESSRRGVCRISNGPSTELMSTRVESGHDANVCFG